MKVAATGRDELRGGELRARVLCRGHTIRGKAEVLRPLPEKLRHAGREPEVVVECVVDVAALRMDQNVLRRRLENVVAHLIVLGELNPELAEAGVERVVLE